MHSASFVASYSKIHLLATVFIKMKSLSMSPEGPMMLPEGRRAELEGTMVGDKRSFNSFIMSFYTGL